MSTNKKKIKTSEIAAIAGVSPATVSRVINHRELVADETVSKIAAAFESLGLKLPPFEEKSTKKGATILINFPKGTNPFYEEVIEGAMASAAAHGFDVVYNYENLNRNSFSHFVQLVENINAAGVILLVKLNEELLEQLNSIVPVVQCCEYNKKSPLPYVGIDDFDAARKATQYIIASGRNKIALLNGPLSAKYAQDRLDGFLSVMEEASLSVPSGWLINVPEINYEIAYSMVTQLLQSESRPNAFFATSDFLAAAVVNAARNLHIHVPEHIMVVGFDNILLCQMIRPMLTSVNQPKFRLGFSACEILTEIIENPDIVPHSILLPTELIVRESSTLT